jgi:hypothetical protein
VTKYLRKPTQKRKDLFGLTVPEVSMYGNLTQFFLGL